MLKTILNSKIHRATVTEANLDYIGSITIDRNLMEAAGVCENEQVHVLNIANGNRFITYVIPGERGQGDICINGAAAHLAKEGDLVIICSYAQLDATELEKHQPTVILVDGKNKAVQELNNEGPFLKA